MNWLAYLQDWFHRDWAKWSQHGIEADLTIPSVASDNNSSRVDFDAKGYMGRVTIWETGDCDIEILSVSSEELILWKHFTFRDIQEADVVLLEYVKRLEDNQPSDQIQDREE